MYTGTILDSLYFGKCVKLTGIMLNYVENQADEYDGRAAGPVWRTRVLSSHGGFLTSTLKNRSIP